MIMLNVFTKPIEGFFIESLEGLIFDVKGLVHPPDRVIAYVRYIPDEKGSRIRQNIRYRKIYSLGERERFLKENYPKYLYKDPVFNTVLQAVPIDKIAKIYDPRLKLKELVHKKSLTIVEKAALDLALIIKEKAGIKLEDIGVSGSILVDLSTESSDIDLVVYGERAGWNAYYALKKLFDEGVVDKYDRRSLEKLYEFRVKDTSINFEDFVKVESRKVLQGLFRSRDFYVRLVKKPSEYGENYGDRIYESLGYQVISAEVVEDKDSIFTPCKYLISNVKVLEGCSRYIVDEIVSYRGRFCEIATKGERIRARGKVEKVTDKKGRINYRLLVGENREDYIVLG
ncbi:MAG: hypothetical protein B6U95_01350 [Thermofilum sp. ex4484_82]|nr:MAG: hypothetical protein B6U95_01350 [Thermofilum sp. ex4484_82]OYT39739.1 MAG: hypothetical protein B6U96_01355 [Archaeoglobales archaeon ex4484_92]